jgi:DNA-binding MarR family transcriptional regulator
MHRLEQSINLAVLNAIRAAGYEGLSPSHIGFLDQMGAGCRMGELARRLGVTRAAVSQLADQLEALRLVERTPDPDDRRAVVVIPTEAVRRGWAIARAAVDGMEGRWRAELGERRFRAMADAIARLVALEDADGRADREHCAARIRARVPIGG